MVWCGVWCGVVWCGVVCGCVSTKRIYNEISATVNIFDYFSHDLVRVRLGQFEILFQSVSQLQLPTTI